MSFPGHSQPIWHIRAESALPSTPDLGETSGHVSFVPIGDIPDPSIRVTAPAPIDWSPFNMNGRNEYLPSVIRTNDVVRLAPFTNNSPVQAHQLPFQCRKRATRSNGLHDKIAKATA